MSGSSFTTLGVTAAGDLPTTEAAIVEAVLGLGLVALLISYLPSIYSSFQRRELAVSMLETRAGNPPSRGRAAATPPPDRLARRRRAALRHVGGVVRRHRGDPHVAGDAGVLPLSAARTARGSPPPARCSTAAALNCRWSTSHGSRDAALCLRAGLSVAAPDRRLLRHPATTPTRDRTIRSASLATSSTTPVASWRRSAFRSRPIASRPGATSTAGGSTTTRSSSTWPGSRWPRMRPGRRTARSATGSGLSRWPMPPESAGCSDGERRLEVADVLPECWPLTSASVGRTVNPTPVLWVSQYRSATRLR